MFNKTYTLMNLRFRLSDEAIEDLKNDCEDFDSLPEQEQENIVYNYVQGLACEFTSIYGLEVDYFMVDEV